MRFTHRGLEITCDVAPSQAATWDDPPFVGDIDNLEWDVDDIDAVLVNLDLPGEYLDRTIRACYGATGRLPNAVVDRIDRDWNLTDVAYDAATDYNPRDDDA
tara:strand:+ start:11272 stop:11577 length:306 start_codon:yes stop_codon:yes gene_type:complete